MLIFHWILLYRVFCVENLEVSEDFTLIGSVWRKVWIILKLTTGFNQTVQQLFGDYLLINVVACLGYFCCWYDKTILMHPIYMS